MAFPSISSLQEWREHARTAQSQGQWCYDALWAPLAPFFETHGYSLWLNNSKGKPLEERSLGPLRPPNSLQRNFNGDLYCSHYDKDREMPQRVWQQMSSVICPARTAKNHDVIIRLVAVGTFGEQHVQALDRVGALNVPQNHTVPLLDRLVCEFEHQYHFAVFPMMGELWSLPELRDHPEAPVDYIEQLIEGLDFLHDRLVSHGDICTENILVNIVGFPFNQHSFPRSQVRYYYTDLEFARCFADHESLLVQGTPISWSNRNGVYSRPSAPELSLTGFYNPFQADIWQLGHLLRSEVKDIAHLEGYQLLFDEMTRDNPDERISLKEALARIRQLKLLDPPKSLPGDEESISISSGMLPVL